MKDIFEEIAKIYNIDKLIENPKKLLGGITNKVYYIKTTSGEYVVKILSKSDIDKFELSESIADKASNNNINALCAIKNENKYVTSINDYNIMLYPYYDGKVLLTKELTLDHIRLLANALAHLHKINVPDNFKVIKYKKNNFKKLYELSLKNNNICFSFFKENIDKLIKIYDDVYSSYLKLSNQKSYVHKDFNRKNVLWNNTDFKIIDWETATIDNPSIDFFNSLWFLSNDYQEDKAKVFLNEYLNIMTLKDDFNISVKASIIEECNWLAFSLKRALGLITNDEYEIKIGEESINSSLKEIINYYEKIDLILKYIYELNI